MNDPLFIPINHNAPVVSVSELSAALKAHVEHSFNHVRVRGEVSGLHRASSGHIYFSLKDDNSLLEGVCWRQIATKVASQLEDGAEVIITGRITTYPSRSRYQIIVESVEVAGIGALLKMLEERKQRLSAERLFSEERKRPLPYLPEIIGVITSPTGAVLRDILHRLRDRFPCHVVVWPVLVQGQDAARQVVEAIEGFNAYGLESHVDRPDVLIVARGGGSLEDLWPFNDEVMVRAVAASNIPVISAVGHETDTTLIDYAADVRAPTPTAAAEISVPVRYELQSELLVHQRRLISAANRSVADRRLRLEPASRSLPLARRMPTELEQKLDQWVDRLERSVHHTLAEFVHGMSIASGGLVAPNEFVVPAAARLTSAIQRFAACSQRLLTKKVHALELAASLLESLSHKKTLSRGFAIVDDGKGKLITSSESIDVVQTIRINFADGSRSATVISRKTKRNSSQIKNDKKDKRQRSFL